MISLAPWLSQTPGLEPMCKGKVPRWTVCRDGMWGKVEGNAWMESGSSVFMKKYWSRSLCMFQSAGKLIWVLFPICQILLNGDQPYLHPKAEVSSFIYVERWKAVVTMTSPLTTECFSHPISKNIIRLFWESFCGGQASGDVIQQRATGWIQNLGCCGKDTASGYVAHSGHHKFVTELQSKYKAGE